MAGLRCPTCHHVYGIHARDGTCPRWANARLDGDLRVCVRVGHKWMPGHLLVYLLDCVDADRVLVWDLQTDTHLEADRATVRTPFTRKPSTEDRANARDEVLRVMGDSTRIITEWRG